MTAAAASASFEAVLGVAFGLVVLGVAGAAARALRGPTRADHVVGLDTVTTLLVAAAGLHALASGHAAYLDIAIALALVAFVATVAFARYVERRGGPAGGPRGRA
jgi:multicomponent Na+:H+ antiporter subunit F